MRTPKKKPFSKSRVNSKYKVKNWSSYNEHLRKRGRIDFMIADDLSQGWYEENLRQRKRGRQLQYSDSAIEQFLKIRCLFGLKLRQTQEFIDYLFKISGLDLKCTDYSLVSKGCKKLELSTVLIESEKKFDHVSIDSTGIQTYTGNEWLENKHGKQYKSRIWEKLHIAIDSKGRILANSMTAHTSEDRSQVESLLSKVKTKELLADPGYDGENTYQILRTKGIKPTIRPPNSPHIIIFNTLFIFFN